MEDGSAKIIQAVREMFEIRDVEEVDSPETQKQCKIALIGRGLGHDDEPWQRSFDHCIA